VRFGHLRPAVAALGFFEALGLHVGPDLRAGRVFARGAGKSRAAARTCSGEAEVSALTVTLSEGCAGLTAPVFPRPLIQLGERHPVPPLDRLQWRG
jgi:hypothetical protein